MRSILNDILAQVRGIWARLDGGQRLVVSAVLIATIAGLGGVVWFAGRPSYETVISPKSAADIASVKTALQSNNISWTIGDDGSFMVERGKVNAAKMAIAEAGLTGVQMPTIGGGASLIEDSDTKSFRLDAASRAQAEAAIRNGLDGVIGVTVTASVPRRAVAFRDREKEQKATATVVLRLRPGCDFNALARGAALLASSQLMVPFDNVEVVSATGGQRWKHDADREAGGGTSDSFLALQQKMSNDRTQKAQERLDQLWPGKTSVAVTIELDPQWEIRSEKVLPESKVVRSEKTSKNSAPSGGAQPADASAGAGGRKDETIDREFVTDIGERRTGKMMPDIKRMSVAVIYDPTIEQAGPIKDDLINTVKAIVGWDPQRDQPEAFSTMVGTFAPIELGAAASEGPGIADVMLRWGPTVGQILGVFVVVMFLRGMFKRTPRAAANAAAAGGGGGGGAAPAKPEVDEASLPPEEQQKRMRREIERSIASDPASLAKMLESWLTEQKA